MHLSPATEHILEALGAFVICPIPFLHLLYVLPRTIFTLIQKGKKLSRTLLYNWLGLCFSLLRWIGNHFKISKSGDEIVPLTVGFNKQEILVREQLSCYLESANLFTEDRSSFFTPFPILSHRCVTSCDQNFESHNSLI